MYRSMLRCGRGEPSDAWKDALSCLRHTKLTSNAPALIDVLINYSRFDLATLAFPTLLYEGQFGTAELLQMRDEFRASSKFAAASSGVDWGERLATLDALQATARFSRPFPNYALRGGVDWNHILRQCNLWHDRMAAEMQKEYVASDEPKWYDLWWERDPNEPWLLVRYPFSRKARTQRMEIVLSEFSPPSTLLVMRTCEKRSEGTRRRIEIVFALNLYRAKTGEYPPDLDALVPAYLEAVPLDPFDKQPMKYRKQEDGYVLYSVGRNGVDDQGRTEDEGLAQSPTKYWDDDVYSVPQQLTPIEAPAEAIDKD